VPVFAAAIMEAYIPGCGTVHLDFEGGVEGFEAFDSKEFDECRDMIFEEKGFNFQVDEENLGEV